MKEMLFCLKRPPLGAGGGTCLATAHLREAQQKTSKLGILFGFYGAR